MEEDLANAGVPPLENHVPPQGNQVLPHDQDQIIPPPITDGNITSAFVTLAQAMTIKAQAMKA